MSGRSAYVRKEKTKVKDGSAGIVANSRHVHSPREQSADGYSMEYGNEHPGYDMTYRPGPARSVVSTGSDELAYARVRKPPTPVIEVSGIEKSSFREMMDKRSEGVRKGLASLSFGKKKKRAEAEDEHKRPGTSVTVPSGVYEVEAPEMYPPMPMQARSLHHQDSKPDIHSPHPMPGPPPSAKLPPVPAGPQLKRWAGAGRSPEPWNKLRKDPELWDPQGDTLVYLGHETINSARPPPSFRISSHVLEATESRFFTTILREGYTDRRNDFNVPPTPDSLSGSGGRAHKKSTNSRGSANTQDPEGQISYEIYFPAPLNLNKVESLRHHATTRNIFALLYQASLVGLSLFQSLVDLQERLQMYMSPEVDAAALIIDYITLKGLDDVRNDPATATSLLAWSEFNSVRWLEGWREAFIHCSGMLNRLDDVLEYRRVTPITKALIERASLKVQVRVQSVEDRLVDFEFSDMWPTKKAILPPEQAAFERLRVFFKGFYEGSFGTWPAPAPAGAEQWLTRSLVRRLQTDFGALYDYLVDRDVIWDGSEERSTRKWNIISTNSSKTVAVDSTDLPMTDILVSFDNRNRYPHIPHPYPLVPDSVPPRYNETSGAASSKSNKKTPQRPVDDKVAERKAALAYTEATNIYILGPTFVDNKLVDAFVRFEKLDRISEVDPSLGRRGRWVLIYAVLQVLASISVDNPAVKHKDEVVYHLNPRLRGTPPWKTGQAEVPEPAHEISHCWLVPKTWVDQNESPRSPPAPRYYGPGISSVRSSTAQSVATESDAGSTRFWADDVPQLDYGKRKPAKRSVRSSGAPSVGNESDTGSSLISPVSTNTARRMNRMAREIDLYPINAGYGPGIQKVEERPVGGWPIREEKADGGSFIDSPDLVIKDFDDYNF